MNLAAPSSVKRIPDRTVRRAAARLMHRLRASLTMKFCSSNDLLILDSSSSYTYLDDYLRLIFDCIYLIYEEVIGEAYDPVD